MARAMRKGLYVLPIAALCLAPVLLPSRAAAHPHIFVETGLKPVLDGQGRLAGVEVIWRYDEFYSLLVLEDMELDGDYDGKLTEAETARLDGFDMNWIEGFAGDLYVAQGDAALTLGPPEKRGTAFTDGKITSRHFRAVEGGAPGTPWVIQAYDPTFYTAYDMGLGVTAPEGCEAEIVAANLDAAQRALQAELAKLPADVESNFPEVGAIFAERIVVTCGTGS